MKKIHVCLVSDQTIPNILAVEQFEPDELLLVTTPVMERKAKAEHILDCLAARGMNYHDRQHVLVVAEDNLLDIHRKLEAWIEGRQGCDFVVNLTGGTKIMSIAAYEFFKVYGSRMIYIPIPRNEYTMPFPKRGAHPPIPLTRRLTVLDYLRAYGLQAPNAKKLEAMSNESRQCRELAAWMVASYDKLKNLLVWVGGALRAHRKDREFHLQGDYEGATNEERELMRRMGIAMTGGRLEKIMPKSEIQFLTGGWLEAYCYNEVVDYLGRGIDDVVIGIQIKNRKGADNEFDVMFTKENALYTVECKSLDQQDDKKTEALYKVGALQKDFGLRVRSFFVSTSPNILNQEGKLKDSILNRAQHLNTVVIAPHEVIHFRQHLADELQLNI